MMVNARRVCQALLMVGLLSITACGVPDSPTAQNEAPTVISSPPLPHPTTAQPTTPTITPDLTSPTVEPASSTAALQPTDFKTPVPTANTTAEEGTAMVETATHAAYEMTRIPPTPVGPLGQALQTLGPHALLYTYGHFLRAFDVDSGASIWLTEPAPTHRCNTISEASGQSGTWSTDGQYMLVLCHNNDHGSVQMLSLATGQLQQVSMFRAEEQAGVTETATWIPGTHQVLMFAQFLESRQYLVGIGDAATLAATPLPELAGVDTASVSPLGDVIAFLRIHPDLNTNDLFLRRSDGTVQQIMPGFIQSFTWTPDGSALDVVRNPRAEATDVETVRFDLASAVVRVLAPYEQRMIWSPDGQHYVAQRVDPHGKTRPWKVYAADGTLERALPKTYSDVCWMPDSQQLLAIATRSVSEDAVVLVDGHGNERSLVRAATGMHFPRQGEAFFLDDTFFPDQGRPVVRDETFFAIFARDASLKVFDLQGHEPSAALPNDGWDQFGGWRP